MRNIPKKWIILCTALVLLFQSTAFASPDEAPKGVSNWAITEVNKAFSLGLIPAGTKSGSMQSAVSRENFCELSVNLYSKLSKADLPTVESSPFTDTNNIAVAQAHQLGIVAGITENEFAPSNALSRQELSKMMLSTLSHSSISISLSEKDMEKVNSFSDREEIADWAVAPLAVMLKYGILNGVGNNRLAPSDVVSKEQAIVITYRAYETFTDDINHDSSIIVPTFPPNPSTGVSPAPVITPEPTPEPTPVATPTPVPSEVPSEAMPPQLSKEQKMQRVFPNGVAFASQEEAQAYMKEITVKVWNIDSKGGKVASTKTLVVNQALADDVVKIFDEIFESGEQFPIKSCGGFQWRKAASGRLSQHSYGTCIDINPTENYQVATDGTPMSGTHWTPGEDPYSIPEDGIVVKTFAKYGFAWGGNAWSEKSAKDYMHFTYLGN